MCLLKIYSKTKSFTGVEELDLFPIYSVTEKGDVTSKRRHRIADEFRISIDVSDAEWDEFDQQVQDAIAFFERYRDDLCELISTHEVTEAFLDFPLYSFF